MAPPSAFSAESQMAEFGLSIVVPVYNGAGTIGRLVAALSDLTVEGGHEIVLVVDGSPDSSLAVCHDLAANAGRVPVTVIAHSRNYGEHNAVMTGFRHVRGRYIINMDDDLQNPPEEVVRLYDACRLGGYDDACRLGGYDVVYTYYETKHHEGWRNLGSRFNSWLADFLLDKPKGLYLSSFRCISRFVADSITKYTGPYPYIDGLIFQVTKSASTLKVQHLPRAEGQSSYTLRRLIRLWMAMALGFSVMPLRLATVLGLVVAALGALGVLVVLVEAMFGTPPTGWSSLASILLIVSGAQLILLGVMGEYVGRTYLTLSARPQSLVRSIVRSDAALSVSEPPPSRQ